MANLDDSGFRRSLLITIKPRVDDAWPVEAVTIMHRIAAQVEADPGFHDRIHFTEVRPDATTADALAQASATIARTVAVSGIIVFTGSGSTARRVSTALAAAQALQAPTPSTALSLTRAPVGSADGRDEDDDQGSLKMRSWGCEKCSDPVCEHRLFTSLRLAATR